MTKLSDYDRRELIFDEVRKERHAQTEEWGVQNHSPFKWLAILGEETGEATKAALDNFDWKAETFGQLHEYREELIQVAAVAIQMVECLDRGAWRREGGEK